MKKINIEIDLDALTKDEVNMLIMLMSKRQISILTDEIELERKEKVVDKSTREQEHYEKEFVFVTPKKQRLSYEESVPYFERMWDLLNERLMTVSDAFKEVGYPTVSKKRRGRHKLVGANYSSGEYTYWLTWLKKTGKFNTYVKDGFIKRPTNRNMALKYMMREKPKVPVTVDHQRIIMANTAINQGEKKQRYNIENIKLPEFQSTSMEGNLLLPNMINNLINVEGAKFTPAIEGLLLGVDDWDSFLVEFFRLSDQISRQFGVTNKFKIKGQFIVYNQ